MIQISSRHLLAINGGDPIRKTLLPYGRQSIDNSDIKAVTDVLSSEWLTTGPFVNKFETRFSEFTGSKNAVAVNSGTAALHSAIFAAGIKTGDEVIVPAITFVATANSVLYLGGVPIFADIEPDTLLIDPDVLHHLITPKTKAIIAMDYAGQPCDYGALREISEDHDLILIADACHSLGGKHKNKMVGSLADLNVFSFHPVKAITTGEGGMITTDDDELAKKMRTFRNHGISTDHRERQIKGTWNYEMVELGFNYRITDFQCALGISQLKKLPHWIERRNFIAQEYVDLLKEFPEVAPLVNKSNNLNAYHLFAILLQSEKLQNQRDFLFQALRAEGIGVNVHYSPVYLHPYYQCNLKYTRGICPEAENIFPRLLTLPIYPVMQEQDLIDVVTAMRKVINAVS